MVKIVETIAEVLAANMVTRRKISRMTQAELAERTELSTTTIQKIERCEAWVGTASIAAIARGLKTTEIALFQAPPEAQNPLRRRVLESLAALPDALLPAVDGTLDGLLRTQTHLSSPAPHKEKKPL